MPALFRLLLAIALLSPTLSQGQNPIDVEFSEMVMREEFSEKNDVWPFLTTMENLYVADKDEYFMHRRHKTNSYAIIPEFENNLSTFNILTTLKLGPAETADQTIGVIFLVQRDGKGAVVFEINKFKQYRIKQMVGAYYKFLSGDSESQGWVKSGNLSNKNEYNEIDIRVKLPQVDIYVNEKFLHSFDVMDYSAGSMGLIIGADTKAKSDYFYVYTTKDGIAKAEEKTKATNEKRSAIEQVSILRYDLEQEKRLLKECEMERDMAVSRLEEELAKAKRAVDKMSIQNKQLQEFKNQVVVEVDEDVYLTLAQSLKSEILRNQKLESQIQVYRDSVKSITTNFDRLKLALLDKSIKKAEKDKVARERKESSETKAEIENELLDKRMQAEFDEWERSTSEPEKEPAQKPKVVSPLVETAAPVAKPKPLEKQTQTAQVPDTKVEIQKEARPLPVIVRKARIKEN
ncbi:hypothetical protein ACFLR1_06900 [Bacteroidota bacterium]